MPSRTSALFRRAVDCFVVISVVIPLFHLKPRPLMVLNCHVGRSRRHHNRQPTPLSASEHRLFTCSARLAVSSPCTSPAGPSRVLPPIVAGSCPWSPPILSLSPTARRAELQRVGPAVWSSGWLRCASRLQRRRVGATLCQMSHRLTA